MADHVALQFEPFHLIGQWDWPEYTHDLRELFLANGIVQEDFKRTFLLASCGRQLLDLIQHVLFDSPEAANQTSFEDIVDKVQHHLDCVKSRLRRHIQQPGESVTEFLAYLRRQADTYFESEQQVRDQLIFGLRDPALRKQLAVLPDSPTVAKILQIVQNAESDQDSTEINASCGAGCVIFRRISTILSSKMRQLKLRKTSGYLPVPDLHAPILSLPPEVLTSIFELLDVQGKGRVAQVCRSWRDATDTNTVWLKKKVRIEVTASDQNHIFSFLAHRGVKKIDLIFPYLREVTTEMKLVLPLTMLNSMSSLTHLSVVNSRMIGDDSVLQISQSFNKLVSFDLIDTTPNITDASIVHICNGLKKLESLSFQTCSYPLVTVAGIKQLADSDLPLRHLDLDNCDALTDESLHYLSLGKQSLESIFLCWRPGAFHVGLEYIAAMKRLQFLRLILEEPLRNDQWKQIASMASLRKLCLSSFNCFSSADSAMQILASGSAPIEKLILDCLEDMTDISLKHLATLPKLRQLFISEAPLVTLEGVEHLMHGNKQLTHLAINHCHVVESKALLSIAANQPNLRQLQLHSMYQQRISKEVLAVMAKKLRHLTNLKVNYWNLLPELISLAT